MLSAVYATPITSVVRPSIRLSVTRVNCIKTAKRIIEILSPSDRPIILVFRHQELLRKSDGFTPNGGGKYKGIAIFDQYAAISRKRLEIEAYLLSKTNMKSYVLYRMVPLSLTLSDPEPKFQGHSIV